MASRTPRHADHVVPVQATAQRQGVGRTRGRARVVVVRNTVVSRSCSARSCSARAPGRPGDGSRRKAMTARIIIYPEAGPAAGRTGKLHSRTVLTPDVPAGLLGYAIAPPSLQRSAAPRSPVGRGGGRHRPRSADRAHPGRRPRGTLCPSTSPYLPSGSTRPASASWSTSPHRSGRKPHYLANGYPEAHVVGRPARRSARSTPARPPPVQ